MLELQDFPSLVSVASLEVNEDNQTYPRRMMGSNIQQRLSSPDLWEDSMEVQFCSAFLDKIASGIPEGKPLSKQEKEQKKAWKAWSRNGEYWWLVACLLLA